MNWEKTIRYQTNIKIGRRVYNVSCESDIDDGYAVYVNKHFVADVETLPTEEELRDIILDNIEIENTIKGGFVASGTFE